MNTYATWTVILAGPATKSLKRIPARDRERIHAVLKEMEVDPFQGDIKYLKGQKERLRRRVGDWHIFFRLVLEQRNVVVSAIERRTSTTY
ncbi:MAG TPA: type II toxin-antitoxin system RelE/ParE family toxin [Terriglobia bacterium]|nr:type II toxin-antitoxin system RelE/ParE family toxin [Terriglobia bacterium]